MRSQRVSSQSTTAGVCGCLDGLTRNLVLLCSCCTASCRCIGWSVVCCLIGSELILMLNKYNIFKFNTFFKLCISFSEFVSLIGIFSNTCPAFFPPAFFFSPNACSCDLLTRFSDGRGDYHWSQSLTSIWPSQIGRKWLRAAARNERLFPPPFVAPVLFCWTGDSSENCSNNLNLFAIGEAKNCFLSSFFSM